MTRHSKVFVPRSVDTPPDKSEFYFGNAIFVNAPTETIKQISHFTHESGVWHTDSKHIKTTEWLEEKENVYVLTEDELIDLLAEFMGMDDIGIKANAKHLLQSKTNPQTENK